MVAPAPLPPSFDRLVDGYRWIEVEAGESGGAVHRLERAGVPPLYCKHGRGRVADDIADEAARLRWLAGRMPAPEIRSFVATGDAAWLLTAALPGRTGDEWFEDAEARPMVVAGFARFLRRLHDLPVADCPFVAGPPLRMAAARANLDAGRIDMEDVDDDHRGWSPERLWNELVDLVPDMIDPVVTHGDYSLGNLLIEADGAVSGCIDIGRLGVADRYQDVAILWQNLTEFGGGLPELFLNEYGIGAVDTRKLAFHRCLDEFF